VILALRRCTTKSDALVGTIPAAAEVVFVTNTQRVVRLPVDSVTLLGKDGTGNPSLKSNEKLSPSPHWHQHQTNQSCIYKRSVLTIVAQVVLENVYKAFLLVSVNELLSQ